MILDNSIEKVYITKNYKVFNEIIKHDTIEKI